MEIKTTYTILTANTETKERAMNACAVFGIRCNYEYRPTCCKRHSVTMTAKTMEQDALMDIIILACTAHAEQRKYIEKLAEKVAEHKANVLNYSRK